MRRLIIRGRSTELHVLKLLWLGCFVMYSLSVYVVCKPCSSFCNTMAFWLMAKIAFGTAVHRCFYLFLVVCLIVLVLYSFRFSVMRLNRGRLYVYCWFGWLVGGCCYTRPFLPPHYANNASYHLTVSPASPQNPAFFYTCLWKTQCLL